uniref:GDSL esterase/lipase LTL1 n=1 Tax=Aegilops tauschii TaxID=37682 RepID=R7W4W5_AEGTA
MATDGSCSIHSWRTAARTMHVLCSADCAAASRIHPPSIPNETDELTPRVRSEAVRAGGAARDRDGHGAAGVRAGGAGAAQQQRGVRGGAANRAVDLFNPQVVDMVRGLNRDAGADVFVSANAYRANFDYLANPQSYGFTNVKAACCGQGPYNGIGLCTAASNVCADREVFAFWDAFHPTERANRIIVGQFMHGSTDYMHPMNLSTILAMDQLQEGPL